MPLGFVYLGPGNTAPHISFTSITVFIEPALELQCIHQKAAEVLYRAGGDLLRLILAQQAAERRVLEEHAGTEGAGSDDGLLKGTPFPLPLMESATDDGVCSLSSHFNFRIGLSNPHHVVNRYNFRLDGDLHRKFGIS